MYKKQDTNEFIAFKSLFNQNLHDALMDNDIAALMDMLHKDYKHETYNDFYNHTKINTKEIKEQYNQFMQDIANDPYLIYKL
ncbi:hypothetical protein CIL05_07035 [Virgibacillus profundi]|uniref:Uncharacterized protein n=1 Tax=Virgibacillus profundi TaxID=2024555 RepID=A0A2A2IG41_9BACI|nr:hypothetical protein [Virgibacillus profundi]PAV30214.1 hypothetical protein CIL05_07035 [Virgibacillus profundi]PXY54386.1 hypothetical protein CIT14_07120 [Virgibacillus profundi]